MRERKGSEMSQEHIDEQERIDELYDRWEAEYQKRAVLTEKLHALVESWKASCELNRQILRGDFISNEQTRVNMVAHMTEREHCICALEEIIGSRDAKGE